MTTTEKKKVIITLSTVFPGDHPRQGEPTKFVKSLKAGVKIHTIRANDKELWEARANDINTGRKYLSVREWIGRPYNSEQREVARYERVGLQRIQIIYDRNIQIPPTTIVDGKLISLAMIAKNDGLSLQDLLDYFFPDGDGYFRGVIIHFTDFRY